MGVWRRLGTGLEGNGFVVGHGVVQAAVDGLAVGVDVEGEGEKGGEPMRRRHLAYLQREVEREK